MVRLTSKVFRMRISDDDIEKIDFIIKQTYPHQTYVTTTKVIKELIYKEYDRLIKEQFKKI